MKSLVLHGYVINVGSDLASAISPKVTAAQSFELPKSKIEGTAKVVRETAKEVSRQLGRADTQE